MSITLSALQKQRRDTAANWTAENPTLLAGEIGLESDTGYWKVGNGSSAWNSLAYVPGLGAELPVSRLADGTARQLLQTAANGTDVEWTSNVDVPGTLDVTGAAIFDNNVTVQGDLTVNGTEVIINTQTLEVEDKNVIIGKVATPTDLTADGGGITLKGTTDKTINWIDATDAWTLSEHVNIASGKEYRINGTKVLDATSLGSSVLITSANITDGTIVNGDVSASAAIAGTKISPDFGGQNVTTTGTATASALIPSGSTVPTNGVYLPSANNVAISTNGTGRLFVDASGNLLVGTSSSVVSGYKLQINGSGGVASTANTAIELGIRTPDATFNDSYLSFGTPTQNRAQIYCTGPAANTGSLVFNTYNAGAGAERMRLDSSGRLGLGTSSVSEKLHVVDAGTSIGAGSAVARFMDATNIKGVFLGYDADEIGGSIYGANFLSFQTYNGTSWGERVRISPTGAVGIGTTSASTALEVKADYVGGTGQLRVNGNSGQRYTGLSLANNGTGKLLVYHDNTDDIVRIDAQSATGSLSFGSNGEAFRVDSSKRLLVGTSTARDKIFNSSSIAPQIQLEGTSNASRMVSLVGNLNSNSAAGLLLLGASRGTTPGSNTIVQSGDELGLISFQGSDGAELVEGARIEAYVDGTPGANDMPGRLVFSTTADGASSPTERLRLTRTGDHVIYNSSYVYPSADNVTQLGLSGGRWSSVWAANGTIQTSDQRAKTEISTAQLGSDFIKALRPVSYKWIEGGKHHTGEYDEDNNWVYESVPGTRTHWGFIAQEVKQAVDAAGVDFGGWVLTDKDDPDSQQALRYDQFIAPLTKALQETMAELEALKAEVAALKAS